MIGHETVIELLTRMQAADGTRKSVPDACSATEYAGFLFHNILAELVHSTKSNATFTGHIKQTKKGYKLVVQNVRVDKDALSRMETAGEQLPSAFKGCLVRIFDTIFYTEASKTPHEYALIGPDLDESMIGPVTGERCSYVSNLIYMFMATRNMLDFSFPIHDVLLTPAQPTEAVLCPFYDWVDTPELNITQHAALAKSTGRLSIIQGPPGTGKTDLIHQVVARLVPGDRSAAVVAQTNYAIASVVDKLKHVYRPILESDLTDDDVPIKATEGGRQLSFVVIGHETSVCESAVPYLLQNQAKSFAEKDVAFQGILGDLHASLNQWKAMEDTGEDRSQVENTLSLHMAKARSYLEARVKELEDVIFRRADLILCTIDSLHMVGSRKVQPHTILIDEASTVREESMPLVCQLGPEALVLLGDPKQLGPFTASEQIAESFMERAVRAGASYTMLDTQYRMPSDIGQLVSNTWYDGRVQNGVERGEASIRWVNHEQPEAKLDSSFINTHEAIVTRNLLEGLRVTHPDATIMVISFYKAHVNWLEKALAPVLKACDRIATVDACQGTEADIVILNCVRSGASTVGFTDHPNRLNVAMSRAKQGCFVVGNKRHLCRLSPMWATVAAQIPTGMDTAMPLAAHPPYDPEYPVWAPMVA